jgi:hypothetical protein
VADHILGGWEVGRGDRDVVTTTRDAIVLFLCPFLRFEISHNCLCASIFVHSSVSSSALSKLIFTSRDLVKSSDVMKKNSWQEVVVLLNGKLSNL